MNQYGNPQNPPKRGFDPTARDASQKMARDRYIGEYAEKDEWSVLACLAKEGAWFFNELQTANVTAKAFLDSRAAFAWSVLAFHITDGRPMSEDALIRTIDDRLAEDRIRAANSDKFKPTYLNLSGESLTMILKHTYEYQVDVETARFIGSRLVSRWRFRTAQKALSQLTADSMTWTDTPEAFVDHCLAKVMALPSAADTGRGVTNLGEFIGPYLDSLYAAYQEGKPISGLYTGFPKLDKITNGMMPGDFVVIAAGSGVGKTSMAINIAANVARKDKRVLIFSLEMTLEQVTKRLIFMSAQVDSGDYYQRKMDDSKWGAISRATAIMQSHNINVVDDASITLPKMHSMAQQIAFSEGVDLIIVDYAQLLPSGEATNPDKREQEVRAVADGLKRLASSLGVPLIALSQLNDEGKVRESRALKFNASHLWILSVDSEQNGIDKEGPTKRYILTIDKGRDSASGAQVRMLYWFAQTRFEEEADVEDFV